MKPVVVTNTPRIDRSVVPVGCSLCGSKAVAGTATPSLVASA